MVEVIVEDFKEGTDTRDLSISNSTYFLHHWGTNFLSIVHGKGFVEVLKCWNNAFTKFVSNMFYLGVVYFFSKRNLLEMLQALCCQSICPRQVYLCKSIRKDNDHGNIASEFTLLTNHNSQKHSILKEAFY